MAAVTIQCNHCGAPLKVSATTRFVTCAHCGSHLEVMHGDGSIYTELLAEISERTAEIQDQTIEIQDQLEDLSLRTELSDIDREWEREREQYMVTDEHGQKHDPGNPILVIGLVIAIVGGLFMLVMVSSVTSKMSDMSSSMGPSFRSGPVRLSDGTPLEYRDGSLVVPSGRVSNPSDAFDTMSVIAPLIVLLMIGGAVAMLVNHLRKADQYAQAEQAYHARRERVASQLDDD